MYCRRCGKRIDYDAPLCRECEEELGRVRPRIGATQVTHATEYPAYRPMPVGNGKEGFGKALASTIMGNLSIFLFLIGLVVLTKGTVSLYSSTSTTTIVMGVLLILASFGIAIPAFIMGIKSIKCFARAKGEGRVRPVGTLVCGIIGLVPSAIMVFYLGIILLVLMLNLMMLR